MPVNIAVIGTGHMGRIHLDKLAALDGVTVTALADIAEKASGPIAEKYGIPLCRDCRDIVTPLDGVVIATPTETHHAIASWFLMRDVHVFMEKPIAASSEEAHDLVRLARERGRALQIGHLERFNPAFKEAGNYVKRPLILDAVRTSPFSGRSTDIDVIHDLMIHDIDLVLSLTKSEVREIHAHGVPLVSERTDVAQARIEFDDGSIASLFASRISPVRERRLTIYERDRCFFIDLLKGSLSGSIKTGSTEISSVEFQAEKIDPVRDELVEFVEVILGKRKPTVSGGDGLRALTLAGQIAGSIADRK
jgi:predicted dehydrogenase